MKDQTAASRPTDLKAAFVLPLDVLMAAWREAAYFTDAERAALALTEAVTRLADRVDPVPDLVWDEASRHYDEQGLATLVLIIATTNLFNRLNATTRQVGGATKW